MNSSKKPILLNPGHTDEMFTPGYALDPLMKFVSKDKAIWEPFPGEHHMTNSLLERGYTCIRTSCDFWTEHPIEYDMIITNPPYSSKDLVIEHCYELGKPFALLLPLTALEGIKRGNLYRQHGIQLIIPNRRVNFITPKGGKSSWFQVAWFTWGLHLPRDLMFVELVRGD